MSDSDIEIGRGSAITQLNLPHPEVRLRKARLMNVINDVLKRRGLSQRDAVEQTGLNQSEISRIVHGRGSRFLTDRLLAVLARLDVAIEMTQRRDDAGNLVIEVRELTSA